jgi:hypothetical protein
VIPRSRRQTRQPSRESVLVYSHYRRFLQDQSSVKWESQLQGIMASGITHPTAPPVSSDILKNWIMVVLTLVFITLYGAALTGLLKPLTDEKMVLRLEPIIFVIIGYYFGRLPGQQNEKTLKHEINRQTQRYDAAQSAKEQALQANEAMEEKMKNVKATLSAEVAAFATASGSHSLRSATLRDDELRPMVNAALRILNS